MPAVASYNIINATNGTVTVDNITLTKLGQKAGIIYRSPSINAAITKGLITIENTLTPANQVTNITTYMNELAGILPVVEPMPVGVAV